MDGKERVRVKFRPCIGKLDDDSVKVINRNAIETGRIKADGISVVDFIGELGKMVVWGSSQELELGSYVGRGNYRRITTAAQLFEAIVHGRRRTGDPEITIYADIIDGREDSPVGLVRSQAAEAMNDAAFLADSEPVRNVRDFGPNSLNPPEDLGSGQGEGPSVDWNKVDIDLPTDIALQIVSEEKLAKLLGSRLPNDKRTFLPPPPEQGVPLDQHGDDYEDEVELLFAQGGEEVDDRNEEEMRTYGGIEDGFQVICCEERVSREDSMD
ncbi:hypothetical protein BRADI_2g43854v3 [Brachypodium distachyon]|uniref:Uncharacterized protein n=1 Tax=Brachypodium distachyon TaxID=15368 RepID=A0A2K2DDR8_BRADI|nr:hypothetical protein BRADI_2g43854v3 [Brachypodium distachyon]